MNQFKRAKGVMLPTRDNHSQLEIDDLNTNKLSFELKQYVCKNPQHLYIISEDEIKEGDWCYCKLDSKPIQYFKEKYQSIRNDIREYGYKKIIATTDTSVTYNYYDSDSYGIPQVFKLPQPSQQFIEKYIESYNKGEVITDLLVEYSPSSITLQTYSNQQIDDSLKALSLKVNPKDNTITTKKLKDNFTINEIEKALINTKLLTNNEFKDIWKVMKENLNLG